MSTNMDISPNSASSVLGALLVGLVIHTFLGGVTLVQLIQFYTTSSKDTKLLKGLVFVLAMSEFWTYVIWLFLHKDATIIWFSISMILRSFSLQYGVIRWDSHEIKGFSSDRASIFFKTALATAMTADVLITGGLCLSLHRKTYKFKETNRIISWITVYVISSCLLTTLTQMFTLIAYIAWPNTTIFVGIWFVVPKLYFNSLLATLNSRVLFQKNNLVVNVSTDFPLQLVSRNASGPDHAGRELGPDEGPGIDRSKVTIGDFVSQSGHILMV
ncbi:hypothetical protein BDP27DRAFT_1421015 [Rhodocollybia butyracea]|uniref:DUF6534 domain-containing protein n=1 Tax=Rhodocollybia butyracea TaxID=206335 RepID=A0A9P5PNY8_9AGAR|nr:hypothetical protein BDP27DRAFT_1421015 [Rhodocollybia butyracea]